MDLMDEDKWKVVRVLEVGCLRPRFIPPTLHCAKANAFLTRCTNGDVVHVSDESCQCCQRPEARKEREKGQAANRRLRRHFGWSICRYPRSQHDVKTFKLGKPSSYTGHEGFFRIVPARAWTVVNRYYDGSVDLTRGGGCTALAFA
jgi:hypothetical protein